MNNIYHSYVALCYLLILSASFRFIIYPFRNNYWEKMLYSKVYVQAFATTSMAVALCSLVIKGTQWRSQEL